MVWIKTEKNAVGKQTIIGNRDGKDHPASWSLASLANGSWVCNLSDGKHNFEYAATPLRQIINDGQWHQLALTVNRDRKEARFYYDGRNVGIYNIRGLGSISSKLETWIGSNGASPGSDKTENRFNGFIGRTRIWNRAISGKEIESDFFLMQWSKRRMPVEQPVKDLRVADGPMESMLACSA